MVSRIPSFYLRCAQLLAAASFVAVVAGQGTVAVAGEIHRVEQAAALAPETSDAEEGRQVAIRALRTAQLEWLFGPRRPEPARGYYNNGYSGYGNDGGPVYAPPQYREYDGRLRRTRDSRRLSNTALRRKMENREWLSRSAQRKRDRALARADRDASDIWRGGFTEERVAARLKASPLPPPTKGPLLVTVSIEKQRLTLYDEGVPIAETPVSTGMRGRETPLGVFSVLQKEQWHRSNLYDDAPMPYMQRLTWDGIALHGGIVPRYPASHGCIRIPEKFAIRLWNTTQRGARVIISQNDVKPIGISHPLLFRTRTEPPPESVPLPQPSPQRNPAPTQPQGVPQVRLDDGSRATAAIAADPAELADYIQDALAEDEPSLRDQVEQSIPAIAEIALIRGGMPVEVVSIAPPAGKMKRAAAVPASSDAPPAVQKVALRDVTIIRGGRPTEVRTIEMPSEDVVQVAARPTGATLARSDRGELPIMIAYGGDDAAELIARLNPRLAQSLGQPIPDAPAEATPAAPPPVQAAADPMNRKGKLSVFISRARQHIYVRKGFRPVFDMPIRIVAPRQPMGTYVFTAYAADGSNEFRWTTVAVGSSGEGRMAYDGDRSDLRDAQRALDRIQLPPEASEKLARMVGVGASIIVSDRAPAQLGEYDDFSVVLRAAPQNATLTTNVRPRKKVRR